jgi:Ni2+-binding GTPase involved in maturation of urease and hydrogenase
MEQMYQNRDSLLIKKPAGPGKKKKKKKNPLLDGAKRLLLNKKNVAPAAKAMQSITDRNKRLKKLIDNM